MMNRRDFLAGTTALAGVSAHYWMPDLEMPSARDKIEVVHRTVHSSDWSEVVKTEFGTELRIHVEVWTE